jgi:hypothetical protein
MEKREFTVVSNEKDFERMDRSEGDVWVTIGLIAGRG